LSAFSNYMTSHDNKSINILWVWNILTRNSGRTFRVGLNGMLFVLYRLFDANIPHYLWIRMQAVQLSYQCDRTYTFSGCKHSVLWMLKHNSYLLFDPSKNMCQKNDKKIELEVYTWRLFVEELWGRKILASLQAFSTICNIFVWQNDWRCRPNLKPLGSVV
jgi:hypothetical protein